MKLRDALEIIDLLEDANAILPEQEGSASLEELRAALGAANAAAHYCASELKVASAQAGDAQPARVSHVTA
jgi:hypothetical protein